MVTAVQGRYAVSERYSCRALGFERTALRYQPIRPARDAPLRAHLREMAAGPKDIWGIDVVSDQLATGRRFRCFTIVDRAGHEAPAVARQRERVSQPRLRCVGRRPWDRALLHPAGQAGAERLHRALQRQARDECLNQHWFLSLRDAQFHIERWRRE